MEDAARKRKARGDDDDGDAPLLLQRRSAAHHEDEEDAVLPLLSALQRAKKPKTRPKTSPLKSTTASEFVDVEVGLRELQKRLNAAASRGKRKASSERKVAASSLVAPDEGDERAKKSKPKAAPAKSTRKKTVETSGDSATSASASKTVRQPRGARASTPASASEAAPASAPAKTAAPASATKTTPARKPRAAAKVKASTSETPTPTKAKATRARSTARASPRGGKTKSITLAEARAAAQQDQQSRVDARVQALQRCANCSSTIAHSHDDNEPGAIPSVPIVSPSLTEAVQTNETAPTQEDISSQTSFIPDDFDEDLAFLQALDEVERKLQPQHEPVTPAPTPTKRNALTHQDKSDVVEPIKSEAVTDITPAVRPAESSTSPPTPSGPVTTIMSDVLTASGSDTVQVQHTKEDPCAQQAQPKDQESERQNEMHDEQQEEQPQQTPDGEPLKQLLVDQTAVPLTILEEFERLKRENEELRRSNAMLQASGATNVGQVHVEAEPDVEESKQSDDSREKRDTIAIQSPPENDAKIATDVVVPTIVAHGHDETRATSTQYDSTEDARSEAASNDVDMEKDDCEDADIVHEIETSTVDRGNYSEYKSNKSRLAVDDGDAMEVDDDDKCSGASYDDCERDREDPGGMEGVNAIVEERLSPRSLVQHDVSSNPATAPNVDNGPIHNPSTASSTDTTMHSDTESEKDEQEVTTATISGVRRRDSVSSAASSSSSSEASEDDEEADSSQGVNALEAALRAATGKSSVQKRERSASTVSVDSSHSATSSPPKKTVNSTKKKAQKARADAKDKSTLLWPTLDEFYDVILELSPRGLRSSDRDSRSRSSSTGIESPLLRELERKRARLPSTYSTLGQYQALQREAILEELVSAVRSAEDMSQYHSTRASLWLTSISPCGRQSMSSTVTSLSRFRQMNDQAIFLESALSSTAKNDVILTFQDTRSNAERRQRRNVLQGFVGGDLVLLRSPSSRGMEISAFGIVLCSSVVAIGGESNSSSSSVGSAPVDPREDQLCVLLRGPDVDSENLGRWTALLEMCLVNQRSSSWTWTLEQVHNLTTSAREYQAIQSLRFMPNETTKMLLQGTTTPSDSIKVKTDSSSISSAPADVALSSTLEQELRRKYNDSQLAAIHGAVDQRRMLSIIQGPPGTGKTKTILGVLSALLDGAALSATRQAKVKSRIRVGASLQQHSSTVATDQKSVAQSSIRILVAAPSNAAVDELIVRLMSEGIFDARMRKTYRPRLVRVGRPESLQQQQRSGNESDVLRKKKWRKYAAEVEEILLESLVNRHKSAFPTVRQARQSIIQNAQIVFCTLSGAGSLAMCELAQHRFDALVIDEAAQAVEASTLIPFKFQPSRIVLVGDHQQLPATVISKRLVELGYDRSLFQRLVERGSKVFLLTQQYRMHPEISWFPSTYFYRGQLVEAAAMKDWTARKYHHSELFRPFVFVDVPTGQQSQVSGSKSLRNLSEIDVIISLLQRLVIDKFPELDWKRKIGIISPYKQQIVELRSELQRWETRRDLQLDIEVNTVDGFQGREKEIIIYSCVRTARSGSSRSKSSGSEAFWADERRMNVAITRAKSSLWIIGNSLLLSQSAAWRALLQHAKDTHRFIPESALEAKGIVVRS